MTMDDFLRRLDVGEDCSDLVAEAQEDERVYQAQCRLDATMREYDDDMTGQDGEEVINQAACDLIAARDARLRRLDPESYNEQKAMGLL